MEEDGVPFSSPYRHYARVVRMRNSRAHYPAARWGHRALPPLRTREVRTARAPWYGAAALLRVRVTGRRALRGPGAPAGDGAHGDAPGKTLSVCYRHYTRVVRTRNSPVAARHRALPPLRSREVRPNCACHNTRITRAHYTRTTSETLNCLRRGTCAKRRFASADSMERKITASG